jgi:hypothetical protein
MGTSRTPDDGRIGAGAATASHLDPIALWSAVQFAAGRSRVHLDLGRHDGRIEIDPAFDVDDALLLGLAQDRLEDLGVVREEMKLSHGSAA